MTDGEWSRREEVRRLAEEHTHEELEQLRRDIEAEIPGATEREASLLQYRKELVEDAIGEKGDSVENDTENEWGSGTP
ncbi:hypothetical protein [Halorubrum miltondacostae]|uniref:Uncharacterized protein n=1 Tax=Halorubrum miltondacostae TaxID=3076378 RepID=A0ABD5M9C2_9EURY